MHVTLAGCKKAQQQLVANSNKPYDKNIYSEFICKDDANFTSPPSEGLGEAFPLHITRVGCKKAQQQLDANSNKPYDKNISSEFICKDDANFTSPPSEGLGEAFPLHITRAGCKKAQQQLDADSNKLYDRNIFLGLNCKDDANFTSPPLEGLGEAFPLHVTLAGCKKAQQQLDANSNKPYDKNIYSEFICKDDANFTSPPCLFPLSCGEGLGVRSGLGEAFVFFATGVLPIEKF